MSCALRKLVNVVTLKEEMYKPLTAAMPRYNIYSLLSKHLTFNPHTYSCFLNVQIF
jgi:hypothetical protein